MTIAHQFIALLVTFIWGTNFVLIKIGLAEIPPFLFVFLRFTMVVFPLVLFFPKPAVSWRMIASYGVFIGLGQFGLMIWAMQDNISPGLASLVIQTQVFFTIILAVIFFGEKTHPNQILALILCATGLLLIASQISQESNNQTSLIGLIVVLIAALNWAAGNLVVKRVGKVNIIAFLVWSSIFALPPLLALSLYFEGLDLILYSIRSASPGAWSILVWQSLGNTLIAYGLWNMLLLNYSASSVTPWALLVPIFGIAASSLVLDEPLPWWKLLASVLILVGLIINAIATRKALLTQNHRASAKD